MSKQVEVDYLEQNLGAILSIIMNDPKYELEFFSGMKKPVPTAQELIQRYEQRQQNQHQTNE